MNPKILVIVTAWSWLLSGAAWAGWTDNWFANSTQSGSSSYHNQQRGFYSAGSYHARWPMTNEPLVTVSPPHIEAGCAGIDLFKGGIGFMDANHLVTKLQNTLQAAPAVAFDIALKVMSKELSETMKGFENITNDLNSLQMNDCANAKKIIAMAHVNENSVAGIVPDAIKQADQKVGASLASFTSWYNGEEQRQANQDEVVNDLHQAVQDCPTQFVDIIQNGSLVDNASSTLGYQGMTTMIRGWIGDVEVSFPVTAKAPLVHNVNPCPENNGKGIDDFVTGDVKVRTLAGVCVQDKPGGILKDVHTKLVSIVDKIKTRTALTQAEQDLVTKAPIPIFAILHDAVARGDDNEVIGVTENVVAYAFAYYVVEDLYINSEQIFHKTREVLNKPGDIGKLCDKSIFLEALHNFDRLYNTVADKRKSARASYHKQLEEQLAMLQFTREQAMRRMEVIKNQSKDLPK